MTIENFLKEYDANYQFGIKAHKEKSIWLLLAGMSAYASDGEMASNFGMTIVCIVFISELLEFWLRYKSYKH